MRFNVDEKASDDPRFTRAGFKLGMHGDEVLGRCLRVWRFCYQKRTDTLTVEDVDGLAGREGFAAVLVAVDLAQEKRSRVPKVRLRGTGEYLKWLKQQDDKRALALAKKRSMARPAGRPNDLESESVPVSDLDRERDRSPSPSWLPGAEARKRARDLGTELAAETDAYRNHCAAKGTAPNDIGFACWLDKVPRFGPASSPTARLVCAFGDEDADDVERSNYGDH